MKKGWTYFIVISILFMVACNNGEKEQTSNESSNKASQDEPNQNGERNKDEPTEKVDVSLMIHWGEDAFESYFNRFVKEALPHINLTYIQARDKNDIEENFTKGLVPDLVMGSNFQLYKEVDLLNDQMPLIEKHGIDFDRLDPSIMESLKNASPEGQLSALPLFRPDGMVGYNKDIFDTFGIPYPEDHITWDEAIELAKKMTGERDGRIYHGIWPDKDQLSQVGANLLDAETNEPNILNNKELRIFLERQETIFNIPGNLPKMDSTDELAQYMYEKSGSVDLLFDYAFVPGVGFHGILSREVEDGLNVDWVTYPVWGDGYADYIPNSLYHNILVTSQSENPDAAFEVIQYFLSDEFQKHSVSEGRLTPLVNEEVRAEIGKQMEHYDRLVEKNWQAQFAIPGAPVPKQSTYEGAIQKELMINAYRRTLGGEDLNTILRKMDEEAASLVADLIEKE